MSATTTLKELVEALVERTSLGSVLPAVTQVAASLTLADGYGAGPFSTQRWGRGAAVFLTSPAEGGTATACTTTVLTDASKAWTVDEWIGMVVRMGGKKATITDSDATTLTFAATDAAMVLGPYTIEMPSTYVDTYTPSTGVITVDPDFTAAFDAAQTKPRSAVILDKSIEHMDVVRDAINRALEHRSGRWVRVPFTQGLAGADMRGLATDWLLTNARVAYVTTQAGENASDRTMDVTTTSTNGYASTGNIPVHAGDTWDIQTAMITYNASNTARITVRDVTNSANITPTFTIGAASTTSRSLVTVQCNVLIPAGCSQMEIRFGADESGAEVGFAPLVTAVRGAKFYAAGGWVPGPDEIGNLWTVSYAAGSTAQPAGPENARWREVNWLYNVQGYGDGITVDFFGETPPFPLYYEAWVPGETLHAMTSTTAQPVEDVLLWAAYELRKRIYDQQRTKETKDAALEAKRAAERQTRRPLVVLTGRR